MIATYPNQYICFFPMSFDTKKDGEVFVFTAMDAYSKFVFLTGIEKDQQQHSILKHVQLLLNHKDFKLQPGKPFTLVFHKYKEIQKQIEQIIQPLGGSMIIDDPFLAQQMAPLMEDIFRSIATQLGK